MDENEVEPFGFDSIVDLRKAGNVRIAGGAFGSISIGLQISDKRPRLAILKRLQGAHVMGKLRQDARQEIRALSALQHANIVELLALFPLDSETVTLALEYCVADLYDMLEWRRKNIMMLVPAPIVKTIAVDLLCALNFCHDKGILHRDVNPRNVFISPTGVLKLGDFGLATMANDEQEEPAAVCALYYRSPELLLGAKPTSPSMDIFSMGLVIVEALIGRPLFQGRSELDQINRILKYLGSPTDTHWPDAKNLRDYGVVRQLAYPPLALGDFIPRATEHPGLDVFLEGCLALDPTKRLSASELLDHPGIQSGIRAKHSECIDELVPDAVRTPCMLTSPSADWTVATGQALALAEQRRKALS